jgi:hypothetical protein
MRNIETKRILAIDTDSYAGNFEREMCAYITGIVGGCEVGSEIAQEVANDVVEYDFDELISQVPDDHGCYRPVSMGGDDNQSVYIFYEEEMTRSHIDIMIKRAKEYAKNKISGFQDTKSTPLKIKGFRLLKEQTIISEVENLKMGI